MKVDFIGFERAYAETSTHEVLLNLARLKNHETTYFFKLGQISTTYRMQASLAANGNYTIPPVNIGGNATGGGNPGLIFENDPSFTFIPVNDDTSAQLLLKPIPSTTLYNLYQQGWRVDQLFRLMVDRIEVTVPADPTKKTPCMVKTILNSPPQGSAPAASVSDDTYNAEASSYAAFLRVSAMVYGLQKSGYLKMRGRSDFIPIDPGSFIPQSDPASKKPDSGAGTSTSAGSDASTPKASDFAAAAAKGQSWRFDDKQKQWVLYEQIQSAEFYLTAAPSDIKNEIAQNKISFLSDPQNPLLSSETPAFVYQILDKGFSIDEVPGNSGAVDQTCGRNGATKATAHLVLRSLIGIMAAAAQEEEAFNQLQGYNAPLMPILPGAPSTSFSKSVPKIEQLPLLRLNWKSGEWSGPDIAELNYRNRIYRIADQDPTKDPALSAENAYWNHDMFRLINQLVAQVTVDISKFPLPGIVQLHTD